MNPTEVLSTIALSFSVFFLALYDLTNPEGSHLVNWLTERFKRLVK